MLERLRAGWQAAAILTLNFAVIFCAANFAAWLLQPLIPEGDRSQLRPEELLAAYPGYSLSEIRQIQRETRGRKYVYEAYTQFKEGPVAGQFVNVDETGFRRPPGAGPWPPDPGARNIFVFGGSTTFGYGVADLETLPAALEGLLHQAGCTDARVYNLARSNYFSTQERILFEQLLIEGHVPAIAVFIDGLNEFMATDGQPKFTKRLTYLMAENRGQLFLRALKELPLVRLAKALKKLVHPEPPPREGPDLDAAATRILTRWERNHDLIRAIGASQGISTLFVWQPVPSFGSDRWPIPHARLLARGYELQAQRAQAPDFLSLDHRLGNPAQSMFVDRVHYGAALSSVIAGEIAAVLAPEACFGPLRLPTSQNQ